MNRSLPTLGVLLLTMACAGASPAAEKGPEDPAERPSAQLKKEHTITLKMLDAARAEARKIRRDGRLDRERIARMHDFFSQFVDGCHHAKEERFYFPAAKYYDGEEIDRMAAELVNEHDYARTLLQEVDYQLQQPAAPDADLVADRLERYAEIIRVHIGKEDQLFYPRADVLLPQAEEAGLLTGFARIEKQELGEGFHEKYHTLAMELLGEQE